MRPPRLTAQQRRALELLHRPLDQPPQRSPPRRQDDERDLFTYPRREAPALPTKE